MDVRVRKAADCGLLGPGAGSMMGLGRPDWVTWCQWQQEEANGVAEEEAFYCPLQVKSWDLQQLPMNKRDYGMSPKRPPLGGRGPWPEPPGICPGRKGYPTSRWITRLTGWVLCSLSLTFFGHASLYQSFLIHPSNHLSALTILATLALVFTRPDSLYCL